MNERTIFLEALDKADPAQRSAFLDTACAGDEVTSQLQVRNDRKTAINATAKSRLWEKVRCSPSVDFFMIVAAATNTLSASGRRLPSIMPSINHVRTGASFRTTMPSKPWIPACAILPPLS